MAIVTLLTDFGLEDEYVGVMKGVILGINPSVTLVDLSHHIPPGDARRAGWLLAWAWSFFPKGTLHVAVVDPCVGSHRRILCLKHKGHLFLAPDNGLLSPILEEIQNPSLYAVTHRRYALREISHTFHGRDIFAPAAAHLSKGLSPRRLGPRVKTLKRLPFLKPVPSDGKQISGQVIGFDRFGNAVTNLKRVHLAQWRRRGPLDIWVKGKRLRGIQRSYTDVAEGSLLAVIGSRGLLEISVRGGSASRKLHLKVGDPVLLKA